MKIKTKLTDNSDEVLRELGSAKERALEIIGGKAEGYAKMGSPVDTGRLRNSISHAVQDNTAYIGTNVEYAPYQELGTDRIAPKHFLKNAAQNHGDEYKRIAETEMRR